jgi:hypothetical protein
LLRFIGIDTPVLSPDVVRPLIGLGGLDRDPTSARALAAVQDTFNHWRGESGRTLGEISRVLACSVP